MLGIRVYGNYANLMKTASKDLEDYQLGSLDKEIGNLILTVGSELRKEQFGPVDLTDISFTVRFY